MKNNILKLLIFGSCLWLVFYFSLESSTRQFYIYKIKNGNSIAYEETMVKLTSDYAISLFRNNRYSLKSISYFDNDIIITKYSDLSFTIEKAEQKNAIKKLFELDNKCEIYENLIQSEKLINYMVLYRKLGLVADFSELRLPVDRLIKMCQIFEEE
ncbi:hypothetical protein [Colwellia sp. BRX9-1]|uniref:hypothetical protein n=1 Tax=Colwellia sp. BRX9-1 TaxID=2759830 RepID=UPI0015F6DC60|nr:hypothetical protein [Colwellia sp. BRX9-1]MBA6352951.1 hypothetical protein [Colwellia sp. BRX9-1]